MECLPYLDMDYSVSSSVSSIASQSSNDFLEMRIA